MNTVNPKRVLIERLNNLSNELLSDAQLETFNRIDFQSSCIISAGAGSGKTRLASLLIAKARLLCDETNTRIVTMSRTAKLEVLERTMNLSSKLACDELCLPPMPISSFQTLHAIAFKAQHDFAKSKYGDSYELEVIFKKELVELFKKEIERAERKQGFSSTSFHPISSMEFGNDETAVERAERDIVANMDAKSAADLLYSLRAERLKLCEPIPNSAFGRTAELALTSIAETMSGETAGEGGIHTILADFDFMIAALAESGIPIASAGDVLFVDEAQDLSLCQTKVVLNAMTSGAIVVILGDESQGIFGFSGAMTNTLTEIRGSASRLGFGMIDYKLYKNYRSTESIVTCAEKFLPKDEREKRVGITGNGKPSLPVEMSCCDDEATEVARKLVNVLKAGTPPGEIVVLRHKAFSHGDELDNALRVEAERVGLDKRLLTKAIFGVNVMNSHAMKLCAVLRMALGLDNFVDTPDEAIYLLKDFLKSCGGAKTTTKLALNAIEAVWDEVGCAPGDLFAGHHAKMKAAFAKLEREEDAKNPPKRQKTGEQSQKMKNFEVTVDVAAGAIKECERTVGAWVVGKPIVANGQTTLSFQKNKAPNFADVIRHLSKTIVVKENESETTWLISELERKLHGLKTKEALVDAVSGVISEKISKETDGKLLFSTIHRFKGKERPTVFLMGCSAPFAKPTWPQRANLHSLHDSRCSNRSGMELECACHRFKAGMARICDDITTEKDRLFYVGATRAQTKLYLSCSSDAPPHRALLEMLPDLQKKRNVWTNVAI
jgi:superfamily I DNA/RNA helicase